MRANGPLSHGISPIRAGFNPNHCNAKDQNCPNGKEKARAVMEQSPHLPRRSLPSHSVQRSLRSSAQCQWRRYSDPRSKVGHLHHSQVGCERHVHDHLVEDVVNPVNPIIDPDALHQNNVQLHLFQTRS